MWTGGSGSGIGSGCASASGCVCVVRLGGTNNIAVIIGSAEHTRVGVFPCAHVFGKCVVVLIMVVAVAVALVVIGAVNEVGVRRTT